MAIVIEVIAAVVPVVLLAFGGILCGPCSKDLRSCIQNRYTDFKSHLTEFFKPISREDMDKLSRKKDEIMSVCPSEEKEQERWTRAADNIKTRFDSLPSSNQNGGLLSCCLGGDKRLRCDLHRKVKKLLMEGDQIISRHPVKVEHLFYDAKLEPAAQKPLRRVRKMLADDEVLRIGILGYIAVDNSTFVKKLNNDLHADPYPFRFVIYIPLKGNVNKIDLQKAISERLKLQVKETMDTDAIAGQIRNRLLKEKFLLILDRVSEYIDLKEIGIPEKPGMSKIVLTSQCKDVCELMEAKENTLEISDEDPRALTLTIPTFTADVFQNPGNFSVIIQNLLTDEFDIVFVHTRPFSKKLHCFVDDFYGTKKPAEALCDVE